mmetsp:Transcript_7761/g.31136  ORF Transcript_7761/g.31136 Transcript_7761/m.31136 type:complete len:205 (-) Transcript_7761:1-615(-)
MIRPFIHHQRRSYQVSQYQPQSHGIALRLGQSPKRVRQFLRLEHSRARLHHRLDRAFHRLIPRVRASTRPKHRRALPRPPLARRAFQRRARDVRDGFHHRARLPGGGAIVAFLRQRVHLRRLARDRGAVDRVQQRVVAVDERDELARRASGDDGAVERLRVGASRRHDDGQRRRARVSRVYLVRVRARCSVTSSQRVTSVDGRA